MAGTSGDDKTAELRQRKKEARQSGGPERIAARRRRGGGSARERVLGLLDPDTFVELDVFIAGAVTGHGKVADRDVYVFSEDGEVAPDSPADELTRKIVKVMDLAITNGAPLVGLYDQGPDDALAPGGYAGLFFRNVLASGLVPQIAAIMGPVSGPGVYSPALTDLVVMVKGASHLYLGNQAALTKGGGSLEEAGGARTLSERSGVAHLVVDDESACLETVRRLLSYLPQNNLEDTPLFGAPDPVDRMDQELEALAGSDETEARDVHGVLGHVLDGGEILELMPAWARNIVVGFARLGGRAVGVMANQPAHLGGRLDADASAKGARFVRLCDAFNLPLLTFVDTPGFVAGDEQGQGRIVREAAKLMYACCEATVPKLTVVTHRALAEGYEVMCSKHVRADFNLAWPAAQIGAGGAGARGGQATGSAYEAAAAGLLDDVIEPAATRPRLVAALEACASKRESRPPKKHGNIPL